MRTAAQRYRPDLHSGSGRTHGVDRRRFLGLALSAALYGPAAARAGSPLLAVATCDTEASLAVVDVRAGRVVRSIACARDPRSIERLGGGRALVCHTAVGVLSLVDSSSVHGEIHGFHEPRYTAAHPDGRHAFVTDSGTSELVSVDQVRGRTLGRVRLPEWARHVTIDRAGTTLWVGLGSASERVAVVDVSAPARPRLLRTVKPPFRAHDVGFEPGGGRVWVTSGESGETAIYDRHGRLELRLPADAAPQHVTFAHGRAYVTSGDAGTLHVFSLADRRVLHSVQVPVGSYNVQAGYGLVLTPSLDDGTLSVLGLGGSVLRQVRVAGSSHDACFLA
jgi:DNA-binding beta-propeller fold protein YncE